MTRITRALFGCRYSIHDLSRCKGDGNENLARFNMPPELGMAMALRNLDGEKHDCLALVPGGPCVSAFCFGPGGVRSGHPRWIARDGRAGGNGLALYPKRRHGANNSAGSTCNSNCISYKEAGSHRRLGRITAVVRCRPRCHRSGENTGLISGQSAPNIGTNDRENIMQPETTLTFTRRRALGTSAGLLLGAQTLPLALAASDFWNKKPVSAWSSEEIAQLLARSPWAKEVNAEFELDSDYTANGSSAPSIGRGGLIGAPGTGTNAPAQVEVGRDRSDAPRGARRRAPVTVRWESAQPILDASGAPLPPDLPDRFVLSVSGLPLGVMERRRRGMEAEPISADPRENTPAARQRRMVDQLQASATLEAKGKEAAQPGIVRPVPRMPGTYLFAFSKELLPLNARDREIVFTLKTALMSVRAKFEPKEMLYRGQLAI